MAIALAMAGPVSLAAKGEAGSTPAADPPPACSDGSDNDGDGLTDYPADPGCSDPLGVQEGGPEAPPPGPMQVES